MAKFAEDKTFGYGTTVRVKAGAVRFVTEKLIIELVKLSEKIHFDITIDMPGKS